MLAHSVYFSLNDPSTENRRKMVEACHKYLTGHPGEVFYAAGECSAYDREVNDRAYEIALHVVFADHASHDAYQSAPRHKQFIAECKAMWKNVRVFDADVSSPAK